MTLGFDGSRTRDATALVATEVATGFQQLAGLWERPPNITVWEVPEPEVFAVVDGAFARWDVFALYCDPWKWREALNRWARLYGTRRVVEWQTNQIRQAAYAARRYAHAIAAGEVPHDGNPAFTRHIGAAHRRDTQIEDAEGRLFVLTKERPDSLLVMDAAMAACLSWEARGQAIKAGANQPKEPAGAYFF